jgi:hypothetical protein
LQQSLKAFAAEALAAELKSFCRRAAVFEIKDFWLNIRRSMVFLISLLRSE